MPGTAPKPDGRRARRNKDQIEPTVLKFRPGSQPDLPDSVPWPDETRQWWQVLGESPQAELFMDIDWQFCLDTAMIHADYWAGNLDRSAELRIRMAAIGAGLEARAKLRISFAEADMAEGSVREGDGQTVRRGYANLVPLSFPQQPAAG